MELHFTGRIIEWRGPAPYYFVPVPDEDAVRRPQGLSAGDEVTVMMTVRLET